MRDLAAEGYRTETGDTWRPRNGSHSSQTGKLTSAAIDARDYLRARKDRENTAHLPEGTLVAFTGGKDFADVTAIWRSLDSIKIKYDDMVLLHGVPPIYSICGRNLGILHHPRTPFPDRHKIIDPPPPSSANSSLVVRRPTQNFLPSASRELS